MAAYAGPSGMRFGLMAILPSQGKFPVLRSVQKVQRKLGFQDATSENVTEQFVPSLVERVWLSLRGVLGHAPSFVPNVNVSSNCKHGNIMA